MTNERSLADLQRQLEAAEREAAAWQKSKYGREHAEMAAKLVEALRAEIAKRVSSGKG